MSLAESQAELVAALVRGGSPPPGFDARLLAAARAALLSKRAEEVARLWPRLAGTYGARWSEVFGHWAQARPPAGSLRDGWDFAAEHPPAGMAMVELRVTQALWKPGKSALRRRRLPAVRLCHDGTRRVLILQLAGRVYLLP